MRKIIILITLLISFQYITFSQDQTLIDSLQAVLGQAMQDTSKVKILNRLSHSYLGSNPDKAMDYATQSLALSERANYKKGIASSYNSIGNIFYRKGDFPAALKNYSVSLKINEEIGQKKNIASAYNNIGNIYEREGNYPEALKKYFSALEISEALGDKNNIAGFYLNIGIIYTLQKNYEYASKYLNDALSLSKEIGVLETIKESLRHMGGHSEYSSQDGTKQRSRQNQYFWQHISFSER